MTHIIISILVIYLCSHYQGFISIGQLLCYGWEVAMILCRKFMYFHTVHTKLYIMHDLYTVIRLYFCVSWATALCLHAWWHDRRPSGKALIAWWLELVKVDNAETCSQGRVGAARLPTCYVDVAVVGYARELSLVLVTFAASTLDTILHGHTALKVAQHLNIWFCLHLWSH